MEEPRLSFWVALAENISVTGEKLQNNLVPVGLGEQPCLNTFCQGELKNSACGAAPQLDPVEE